MSSISLNPASAWPGSISSITVTGVGTSWTGTTPTISVDAPSYLTINSQDIVSDTQINLSVTLGSQGGKVVVTDPSTSSTASFIVAGNNFNLPSGRVVISTEQKGNAFYVGNTPTFSLNNTNATTYKVRDYFGSIVASGSVSGSSLTIPSLANILGNFIIWVYGDTNQPVFGYVLGSTAFTVMRQTPDGINLPSLPAANAFTSDGSNSYEDDSGRGFVQGLGPQRLFIPDSSIPENDFPGLDDALVAAKQYYVGDFDPDKGRPLFLQFPNGGTDAPGIQRAVIRYQDRIKYWEMWNEPGVNASFIPFAETFYNAVKAINPQLRVMGPATVGILQGNLGGIDQFLSEGGKNYIDVFSFHAYNLINGDIAMARRTFADFKAVLTKNNFTGEIWQTECGTFPQAYGVGMPRHAARWLMVQRMFFEEIGIPCNHDYWFYDQSHGFWDFPSWFVNGDDSFTVLAILARVWAEETYGKRHAYSYRFAQAEPMWIGILLVGFAGSNVSVFMPTGTIGESLTIRVRGSLSSLIVSDAWGNISTIPVEREFGNSGLATLTFNSELPMYVRHASDIKIEPILPNWGENIARQATIDTQTASLTANRINNGYFENNLIYAGNSGIPPWSSADAGEVLTFPYVIDVNLGGTKTVGRVVVYCNVPWQFQSALTDFDVRTWNGTSWDTQATVTEPPNTVEDFMDYQTSADGCIDYYSERWIFNIPLTPVNTTIVRLYIRNTSYGMAGDLTAFAYGGQASNQIIEIKELEIYSQ